VPNIRTVCIPSSDGSFSDLVDATLRSSADIRAPEDLEAALRPLYPEARVRPRELSGEADLIWYVYRNGVGFMPPGSETGS
jgi:hypothetical protein